MERRTLPVELLDGIFTQLYENEPSNLLPLTLVSRGVYMLVTPLIYRSVKIDNYKHRSPVHKARVCETLIERLLAGPSVCAFVKELRVVNDGEYVNGLASLIPRLVRLESFRWEIEEKFPEDLFQPLLRNGLNSHFRFHLHIEPRCYDDGLSTFDIFLGQACHTLSTLRICIFVLDDTAMEAQRVKSKLFSALKDCSNLRILSTYGRANPERVIDGPWLVVKPGEALPSLRELSVTDDSDIFRQEDLETWGANGRFSNLQKVTFRNVRLLNGIHGCEKTLISINLIEVPEGFEEPLTEICSRLDRLRELSVAGEHLRVPVAALQKCGNSLKSLALRGYDVNRRNKEKRIPLKGVQLIHESCPVLSNLAMSIDRQPNGWNILSILAQFDHLTDIILHVDTHPDHYEMSLSEIDKADLAIIERVFRYLIKYSRRQQLKSLTVYCGHQFSDWYDDEDYKTTSDSAFHASSTTEADQDPEISVRQIQGIFYKGSKVGHLFSYDESGQDAAKKTIDYLNSMPPALLSRMISASGYQAERASSELPNMDYDIRTGGLRSKLATYEADWKASNGVLPLLEWQLQKRREQGWELWEMPLMQGKAGKEGFLYDKLQANKENGNTGSIE